MIYFIKLTKQKKCNSSAFTLLELLVVIIIIGIIVATLSFNVSPNKLEIAADQLINHIKTTQSVALKDDKYQPFPNHTCDNTAEGNIECNRTKYWFKQQWQLRISKTKKGDYFYEIFSDSPTDTSSNFNLVGKPVSEFLFDPQTKKYLTGNYPSRTDEDLNLTKYGIKYIKDKNNKIINSSVRFVFDNQGNIFLNEGYSKGDDNHTNPLDTCRNLLTKNYVLKLCVDLYCNKCIEIVLSPNGDLEKKKCN